MKYRIWKLENNKSRMFAILMEGVFDDCYLATKTAKQYQKDAVKDSLNIVYIVETYTVSMTVMPPEIGFAKFGLSTSYLLAQSDKANAYNEADWEFERSSGYAGYRNKHSFDWIYEAQYNQMKNNDVIYIVVKLDQFKPGEEFGLSEVMVDTKISSQPYGNLLIYTKIK